MSDSLPSPFHVVVYEGSGARPIPAPDAGSLIAELLDHGYAITRVRPSGGSSPALTPPSGIAHLIVAAAFEGDAPALEDAGGAVTLTTVDIGNLAPGDAVARINQIRRESGHTMNQPPEPAAAASSKSWKPWFPVIDYDRCTNCLQCLSFCLFDVYGLDEDRRIEVRNNDNCKTNCPACSRVCPEVAIMFPKYQTGPINGEPVSEQDVQREKMKVDISALLGGDIYAKLRERSESAKSRFSAERSADKALSERQRCLKKLQASGVIPPEVLASIDLASLPSPEEIQAKAARLGN